MSGLVCIANEQGCRVYARPLVEPDNGLELISSTPMTHTADARHLHDTCREIEDGWLDAVVEGASEPRFISVLGVHLAPGTLADLIEAAGMLLRGPLIVPHPVRVGVYGGVALVIADEHSMVALMHFPIGEDMARTYEAVSPIGPRLRAVKGGAK